VWLRYRHTCKNQGNHQWDAQRFFAKAMRDGPYRGQFYRADLNSWEPAAGALVGGREARQSLP
jgi:hypothetical protein